MGSLSNWSSIRKPSIFPSYHFTFDSAQQVIVRIPINGNKDNKNKEPK